MRNAILVSVLTVVMIVGAVAVYAGPPVAGTWKSTNGDFDEGTATTWESPLDYLGTGSLFFGQSYAGGSFTLDWRIGCPTVSSVSVILPLFGATGNAIYKIDYVGGQCILGGPGNPWDGGDLQYTGIIDLMTEIRTVQYVNNKVTGAVSNYNVSAHIVGYTESCVAWAIGNGALRGGNNGAVTYDYGVLQSAKPANYPDFHNNGCFVDPNGQGHWEDIKDLTLTVQGCAVATEQSTWGAVKSMYRD